MGSKAYTPAEKLRIVAWATFRGVPDAARTFGVELATVRKWLAEQPDDDKLRTASDLALSELAGDILDGKQRGRLPVQAGILADKVARYYRPKVTVQKTPEDERADRIMAQLEELTKDERHLLEVAVIAMINGDDPYTEDLSTYLQRRAERTHARMLEQLAKNEVSALLWRAESYLRATA